MTTDTTGQSGGDQPIARTASQIADEASRTAEMQASNTLDRAADAVDQVGQAVRQMSDQLREQQPQVASFAQTAADRIDETGRYLREHEPRELIGALESWARRQPALAIGGALVAGIAAGRFLRAAAPADGSGSRFSAGYGGGSSGMDGARGYDEYAGSGAYGGYGGATAGSGYGTGAMAGSSGLGTTGDDDYGAAGMTSGSGGAITDQDTLAIPVDEVVVTDVEVLPDGAVDDLTSDRSTAGTGAVGSEGR